MSFKFNPNVAPFPDSAHRHEPLLSFYCSRLVIKEEAVKGLSFSGNAAMPMCLLTVGWVLDWWPLGCFCCRAAGCGRD